MPVIGCVQVDTFRPARRLGRGVMTHATTEASSGSTWYLFGLANLAKIGCNFGDIGQLSKSDIGLCEASR